MALGATVESMSYEDFEWLMDINFWGVVYGCRAFTPMMIDRGTGGHVVNLSSAAAYTPQKALTAYSTSKAAVFMLSDCLRAELLPHGIGVSTICPACPNGSARVPTVIERPRLQRGPSRIRQLRRLARLIERYADEQHGELLAAPAPNQIGRAHV